MRSAAGDAHVRTRATRTLVSLTGPAGNIGDALIRRGTLRWALDTSDELIVYTGDSPDVWLRQLGVPDDATVLRSKRSVARWLWMLATAPARPVLVFEAGEVPLHRGNGLRELVFLIETMVVRLKGGVVVRPPRGIRSPSNPSRWLHARAVRLSQVALWRDEASAALIGDGELAPDIGFAAAKSSPESEARDELIVSLRGARPMPDDDWIQAVRATAEAAGLRIRTVVQVREDESRARELASALGGEFDEWGDTDPVAHEESLRARYSRARLVISDRMHVLVLAAIDGAAPAELVPAPTRKIADAFAAVGILDITLDAANAPSPDMQAFLMTQLGRTDQTGERVEAARRRLDEIEDQVRQTIRMSRA
ncbi:polysaccharide pyruvyl transferase family protein [Microbacterium sp. NPDC089321]|uniref:polysaccharide pyruvyl transferase family protein n=1 Tax=Microbacterium sp. NPDC089321 TaxID=3155183 RepID=UPI0034442308